MYNEKVIIEKGGEVLKSEKHYVKLKMKNSSGEDTGGLKTQISRRKVRRRRPNVSYETDRTKRVKTPLEAEMSNKELYSNLGIESSASVRQERRRKALRARRTLMLKPAPAPITAQRSGAFGVLSELRSSFLAHFKKMDIWLFVFAALVAVFGIIAVHSATLTEASHRRYDFLQIFAFCAGVFTIFVLPAFDYGEITKNTKLLFSINILILLYTVIFGESVTGDTNRNWINFFGITKLQPAEFSKVLFILSLSSHLDRVRDRLNSIAVLPGVLLHGGVVIGLVLLQGDMGNALVFAAIFAVMLFCARLDLRYIFGFIFAGILAFPLIWDNLDDFRKKRILIGFNPDLDPLGAGHQVIRSRNAIASGGLFGQGYMQGSTIQRKGALFAKHTDMIFATIGQELGFLGCAALIVLFGLLAWRIIVASLRARDNSGMLICAGVAGMLIFQFIINIGMALGITPVVGITLPLVSYGTSSLISVYCSLALVMSVYVNSNNYVK